MEKDFNNKISSNHGYVYILSNPSMPGLLKIGMTRFEPTRRVQELSSATGVPTPFNLVYYREFSDCVVAESEIHTMLATKGLRYNEQREFFTIKPVDAINALLSLSSAPIAKNSNEQVFAGDYNHDIDWEEFAKKNHESQMEYLHSSTHKDGMNLQISHLSSKWDDNSRKKLQSIVDNGGFTFIELLSSVLYKDDTEKRIEFVLDYTSKGYVSGYIIAVQIYIETLGDISNVEAERKLWIAQQLNDFAKNFQFASKADVYICQSAADYCGMSNLLGLQYDKNLLNAFDLDEDDVFELNSWIAEWSWDRQEMSRELCARLRADKDSYLGTSTIVEHSIFNDERYKSFNTLEGETLFNQGFCYVYGFNGFEKNQIKGEMLLKQAIAHGYKRAYNTLSALHYSDRTMYHQILQDGMNDSCPLCFMLAAERILNDANSPEELSKSVRNKICRYLDLFISQVDLAFFVDADLCLDAIKNYVSISIALRRSINKNKIKSVLNKIRVVSDKEEEDYYFNMGENITCFPNSTSKCKITKCFCKSTLLVLKNSISFLVSH